MQPTLAVPLVGVAVARAPSESIFRCSDLDYAVRKGEACPYERTVARVSEFQVSLDGEPAVLPVSATIHHKHAVVDRAKLKPKRVVVTLDKARVRLSLGQLVHVRRLLDAAASRRGAAGPSGFELGVGSLAMEAIALREDVYRLALRALRVSVCGDT